MFDYVNVVNKIKSLFTVTGSITVGAGLYQNKSIDISVFGFTTPPLIVLVPYNLSSYGSYQIDSVTTSAVQVLFYNHHANTEITVIFQLILLQI